MAKQKDYFALLDFILNHIKDNVGKLNAVPPTHHSVKDKYCLDNSIDPEEYYQAFDKVIKDGYAIQQSPTHYRVTLKGYMLIQRGGYKQEFQNELNNLTFERVLKEQTLKWSRNLTYGTFAAAAGAIGLVAWEILKTFFSEKH